MALREAKAFKGQKPKTKSHSFTTIPLKQTEHKFTNKFQALVHLLLTNNPVRSEKRNSSTKPLDLLILLILNQSTTDELADRAFAQLKKDYPDYKTLLKENKLEKIINSIKVCGLASSKAQYILNALKFLNERDCLDINLKFIKQMSDSEALKTLTQIKGVGVKSASCLLMFAFGRPTFPIDTHLMRIFKRVGGIIPQKASSEQIHKIIQPQITGQEAFIAHITLIELGRSICLSPQKPLCNQCPLNSICDFALTERQGLMRSLPQPQNFNTFNDNHYLGGV